MRDIALTRKQSKGTQQPGDKQKKSGKPAPEKQEPCGQADGRNPKPCPLYRKCGGCQLQNMSYERQLSWKQAETQKLLGKYHTVAPILGMENPYYYRNKVQAAFSLTRDKRVISGVYQASTHHVVAVESCMTEDRKADEIIGTIRGLLPSFKLLPYNEDSGRGFLRHVLVKRGFQSGQIMVTLVTGTPLFPSKNHFVAALRERHPEITTILMNINSSSTSMVLGPVEKVLYGPGYIEDTLCGCVFRISASSFYQINPVQTEVLYQKAIDLAGLSGQERVLDAYCGIGTIGLIASRRARRVIGVEINRDAVRDAAANARRNHIGNAEFYQGDAGEFMRQMQEAGEKLDVLFMDPPRAGSSRTFLSAVAALAPQRVVYISCNPETQARDIGFLVQKGYRVQAIQPVDMFPHTNHVETVVLLSKGEIDSKKVRVEFSLEDMDMSEFQDGATYPQIKEYVLEHTGLKVSNLYISQIKRKCGLEVGKNYNLPKSEDSRQPQCPPEKEKAIREAFKYFGMI